MIIKLPTLFYIMAAQLHASDEYDAVRRSAGDEGDTATNIQRQSSTTTLTTDDKFNNTNTALSFKDFKASNIMPKDNDNNKFGKSNDDEDLSDDENVRRGYMDDYSYAIHSPTSCREIDTNAPPFTPGISGLISPCPPKRNNGATASISKL